MPRYEEGIPSSKNEMAEMLLKGCSSNEISMRLNGPEFLIQSFSKWSFWSSNEIDECKAFSEESKINCNATNVQGSGDSRESMRNIIIIIFIHHGRNYFGLLRTTWNLLMFCKFDQ